MAITRAITGAIDGVDRFRKGQITIPESSEPWVADGAMSRTEGNRDWTGWWAAWGHTPYKMPNDAVSLTMSIEGTTGATGTAIATECRIIADIEKGTPIYNLVRFGGNGALTLGAAVASDTSTAIPPTSQGMKIAIGTLVASPVYTDFCATPKIELAISSDIEPYVSGCEDGQAARVSGNIDAQLEFVYWTDDFSTLPAKNDIKTFRFYVTDTTYWELQWMIVNEVAELKVDREDTKPVGAIIRASFCGFAKVAGVGTKGHILKPDGTTWWPT